MIYEEIDSIYINGNEYKAGREFSCSCSYRIEKIYPMFDPETGKHIPNHKYNGFAFKQLTNGKCLIHGHSKSEI